MGRSEYLLTQLETNVSSVERIVDIAYRKGVKVILNTAPVQPVSDELLGKFDLITPNEVEAEILTRHQGGQRGSGGQGSGLVLLQRG